MLNWFNDNDPQLLLAVYDGFCWAFFFQHLISVVVLLFFCLCIHIHNVIFALCIEVLLFLVLTLRSHQKSAGRTITSFSLVC